MKFEEVTGHSSLYGEIVTLDSYKLQSLVFKPDVIFDIGANIGVFTHYAHKLFPDAKIVAVEPHPANFALLSAYLPSNATAINAALGIGNVSRYPDVNTDDGISGGESYFTQGGDYVVPDLHGHDVFPVSTTAIMLDELVSKHTYPGQRYIVKLDCEGAENLLFVHEPSAKALRRADFVTSELHWFWMASQEHGHGDQLKAATSDAAIAEQMSNLLGTDFRRDSEPPMFYAWRKPDGEPIAGRQDFGRLLDKDDLLGNAAEIGVCSGSYSRDILDWGVKNLLLVDPWKELPTAPSGISDEQHEAYYQECLGHIEGCEDRTTILRMLSVDAAAQTPDESLDFCYIDANHRYEGISVDLELWWPKVRSGGILAGHDYLAMELGVNRAVTEFADKRGLRVHVVIEHQQDASFWIRKP